MSEFQSLDFLVGLKNQVLLITFYHQSIYQNSDLIKLSNLFQADVNIQTVFIDSFYDLKPSPFQTKKFKQYTDQLWKFADNIEPMDMKVKKFVKPFVLDEPWEKAFPLYM